MEDQPPKYEPRGFKTYFWTNIQRIVPKDNATIEWTKLRPYQRKAIKAMKYFTRFLPGASRKIHYSEIDDEEKLAGYIFNRFGCGRYNFVMLDRYIRSKKYDPNFICSETMRTRCKYLKSGKCGRNVFKVGQSCKHNKRIVTAWAIKARVEIYPALEEGYDFDYKYEDGMLKMGSYFFWKGKKAVRRRRRMEPLPEPSDDPRLKNFEKFEV